MSNENLENVISELREIGVSKEICESIRENADAGALEYALYLLAGMPDGTAWDAIPVTAILAIIHVMVACPRNCVA